MWRNRSLHFSGVASIEVTPFLFYRGEYKEPFKVKNYKFDKFNNAIPHEDKKIKKQKFNPANIDFDENIDPIQTNTTDSEILFDNADAISFNLNNKKDNE